MRISPTAKSTELLKDNRSRLAQSIAKQKEYRKLAEEVQAEVAALARNYYQLGVRKAELEALIRQRDEVIAKLQVSLNQSLKSPKKVSLEPIALDDHS